MNNSPEITAKLLLINLSRFADEKNKDYSRCRFSKETLRRISLRSRLREAFVYEVADELESLGWHLIEHSDTEFALIQKDKVDVWPKIASSRVKDLVKESDDEIEEVFSSEVSQPDELCPSED